MYFAQAFRGHAPILMSDGLPLLGVTEAYLDNSVRAGLSVDKDPGFNGDLRILESIKETVAVDRDRVGKMVA